MVSTLCRVSGLSPIVPRMPAAGEPDSVKNLCEFVNHPHVVEVLDALSYGPMTFRQLRAHVGTGRRALVAALRVVGARGLVARTENGSWDTGPSVDAVYWHTDAGGQVHDALSRFSVWTAMYEGVTDYSWKR
jgi:DNA-binding HxlR family transcriptional regulator